MVVGIKERRQNREEKVGYRNSILRLIGKKINPPMNSLNQPEFILMAYAL